MGAQNSLLGLVGAAGIGTAKVAETIAEVAKEKEEEEPKKKEAVKEKKVDENAEALKKANIMIKKADAESELGKLKELYATDKAELGQWKKGLVDVGGGNYMPTNDDLSKDIKMRKKALITMKEKIKARKLQIETYKKLLGGNK